jgi:hypothetical protein
MLAGIPRNCNGVKRMCEKTILREARLAFKTIERHEELLKAPRARLKELCKQYDEATGARGTTPLHLQKAARYLENN